MLSDDPPARSEAQLPERIRKEIKEVERSRYAYAVTLGRETLDLMASVPHMKRATRRAEVYARSEVEAILTAPRQPRFSAKLLEPMQAPDFIGWVRELMEAFRTYFAREIKPVES